MGTNAFTVNYHILKEQKLILEIRAGVATYDALIAFKKKQIQLPDFDASYNMLVDVTGLKADLLIDDIGRYTQFIKQSYPEAVMHSKVASIVGDMSQTIYSVELIKNKLNFTNDMELFKTLSAALNWLGKPISDLQAQEIFNQLKKEKMFVYEG